MKKSPPQAKNFWGPFFQKFDGFWKKFQKINGFQCLHNEKKPGAGTPKIFRGLFHFCPRTPLKNLVTTYDGGPPFLKFQISFHVEAAYFQIFVLEFLDFGIVFHHFFFQFQFLFFNFSNSEISSFKVFLTGSSEISLSMHSYQQLGNISMCSICKADFCLL